MARGYEVTLRLGAATSGVDAAVDRSPPSALTAYLYMIVPKGFLPDQDTGLIRAIVEGSPTASFADMTPAAEPRPKPPSATTRT